MKNIYSYVLWIFLTISLLADTPDNPFTEALEEVDRSEDKISAHFISDEVLKAFGEKRLDKGSVRPMIRITVFRSFHPPLMLKYLLPDENNIQASLQLKRLSWKRTEHETVYTGVDVNKSLKISVVNEKLLRRIYSLGAIQDLPQKGWTSDNYLDGAVWIYEVAGSDSSTLIKRNNPIEPLDDQLTITLKRLLAERHLVSFSLQLFTLAGTDEELY